MSQSLWVRDRFLIIKRTNISSILLSQSLWVRDRFLIESDWAGILADMVAIPLGQGQVFNKSQLICHKGYGSRNPFGSGTGF